MDSAENVHVRTMVPRRRVKKKTIQVLIMG
jgi:hypothetical protein